MLDVTLNTKFVVGTNLRGDMASADWRFLLPSLRFERVLCLGVPELPSLAVLSSMCQTIVVAGRDQRHLAKVVTACAARNISNVQPLLIDNISNMPCAAASIDLLYVTPDKSTRDIFSDKKALSGLSKLLKENGVIYSEAVLSMDRASDQHTMEKLSEPGLARPRVFQVTPTRGEMRTAIPMHDTLMTSYFEKNVLEAPSLISRSIDIVKQFSARQRCAMIAQRSPNELNGHLPAYLSSLAESQGKDIDGYSWGMSAMGRRNTRKVLFFLLNKESGEAEAIIKLTRSAAFNARLENEYRALDHVSKKNVVSAGTFPQPLFFGYSGSLAILGENIIQGKPFRKATTATIDCPYAKAAFEWVIDLGANTANSDPRGAVRTGEVLRNLFVQFTLIYKLTSNEQAFLAKQIEVIEQSTAAFPTVFQHGDPGIWNVMATDGGGVAFLDWEAAEQQGMPLWDLFYLLRSYGTWMSRRTGMRDSLKSFAKNFILPSEPSKLLQRLSREYCERVHLDKSLIEPLFYTCWLHRALKEATRLAPAKIEKGHYVNLLRLCIENRQAAGLAQLFS